MSLGLESEGLKEDGRFNLHLVCVSSLRKGGSRIALSMLPFNCATARRSQHTGAQNSLVTLPGIVELGIIGIRDLRGKSNGRR